MANNDRVGAAVAGIMGNVSVFVMAALIMVSTANSGPILQEVDCFTLWQRRFVFKTSKIK
jgi:hypothetical protein